MQELVSHPGDRPAIIERDGWKVYVSVHDDEYRRQQRAWRQKLAAAHPDRGGSSAAFVKQKAAYDRWSKSEAAWYSAHGLTPPTFTTAQRSPKATTKKQSVAVRLFHILQDRKPRATGQLMSMLGLPDTARSSMCAAVSRLRSCGAEIALVSRGREKDYVLLSDANYKPPHSLGTPQRVLAILSDGQVHTTKALGEQLGQSSGAVHRAVHLLRLSGETVRTIRLATGARAYQLGTTENERTN